MFRTLLAKELLEQRRTSKFLIFLAVFFIVGAMSPVLAKYTPQLLRAIPNVPPEMLSLIPTPTLADSVSQYAKNTSQFGVLLVVLMTMTVISQERERGTAAMLFSKPVGRSALVLSKWLAGLLTVTASVIVSGITCGIYTYVLFKGLPIGKYLIFNLLLLLFLAVYLSIALLSSALARTQGMAAVIAFGGLTVLIVLGTLPRIDNYTPVGLLNWGSSLQLGAGTSHWPALLISIALVVACLLASCLYLEKQEI